MDEMKNTEILARKMCEEAGYTPDREVLQGMLEDGPMRHTYMIPLSPCFKGPCWHLFVPMARTALSNINELKWAEE